MEELIVSVVSLVVLVPIIYFLPLGLSNKGKGVLILVAFLIANLGLIAINNFTLWQTALIILLLTILTVYILEKRLNKFLYSNPSKKEETASVISFKENQDTEKVEKNTSVSSQVPIKLDKAEDIDPIEMTLSKEVDLEEVEELQIDANLPEVEPIVTDLDELPVISDSVIQVDEIDFLENREHSFEEVEEPIELDVSVAETSNYMSEIELLIQSDDLDEHLDKKDDDSSSLDMEHNEAVEQSFIERIEDLDLEELDFKEEDLEEIEESISEEISQNDLIIEAAMEDFNELAEEDAEELTESENVWMLDDLELEDIATTEGDLVPEEVLKELEAVEQEVAASFEEEGSDDNLASYDEEFEIPANLTFENTSEIEEIDLVEPTSTELGHIELVGELPTITEELPFEDEELESETQIIEAEELPLEEEELESELPTMSEESQLEDEELESELPTVPEESQLVEEELEGELPIMEEESELEEEELESKLPIIAEEPVLEDEELESELPIITEESVLDKEELESNLPITEDESVLEDESDFPINAEEPQLEDEEHEQQLNKVEHSSGLNEDLVEESIPVVEQEQKSALQQQLFHNMVSQLHIMRKQMSSAAYEDLIKEHLHPDLPKQDAYTFESLLVEHYISQKELGKLEQLLTEMSQKYTKYPILDMEIHYLYKQYCEKTR